MGKQNRIQNKISEKQIMNFWNQTMGLKSIDKFLGTSYKKLDEKMSRTQIDKNFKLQRAAVDLNLGPNFIMENIPNIVRSQMYSDLKSGLINDKKFGFYAVVDNPQGKEFIYENTTDTSSRTGDVLTDIANISGEPETEIQVLTLPFNTASDMKLNTNIQEWATLSGFTSWLNERIGQLQKAVDKDLHAYNKTNILNYAGYTEIVLDITGLTDEEIAIEFEILVLRITERMSGASGYDGEYNEAVDSVVFDYLLDKSDIGLFLSTNNSVNRKVNFLRNSFQQQEKDFGVGNIEVMQMTESQEIIILPKQKYKYGIQYDGGTTQFAFALHSLETFAAHYGSLFMLSAPAVRITGLITPFNKTTRESYLKKLEIKHENNIKLLKNYESAIKKLKWKKQSEKQYALDTIKSQIEYLEKNKPSLKNVKFIVPEKVKEKKELAAQIKAEKEQSKEIKNLEKDFKKEIKNLKAQLEQEKLSKKELKEKEKELKTQYKRDVDYLKKENSKKNSIKGKNK